MCTRVYARAHAYFFVPLHPLFPIQGEHKYLINIMSNFKNVQPLDDFNWEEFENGSISNASKEAQEESYAATLNKVSEGQVAEGTVISIDKKEVIVNIGYKSDGIIPATEFRYNPDLKVGDKVEVYVDTQEDKKGQLVLSHKKARMFWL